jgi:thiamine biosynthesis lipoprotein
MPPDPARGIRSFRAMGVTVVVGGADRLELRAVRKLFDAWEQRFSRFRSDSELSRVNACAGETVVISPVFARVLRTALSAASATAGLVDPSVGAAVRSAGYDQDFDELFDDPRPPGAAAPGAWRSVRLAGCLLSRPTGVELDLNGVVKALAVDAAARLLSSTGFVSAGGDLAVRGTTTVALTDGSAVQVRSGGLATSGRTRRTWTRGGEPQHHLIDPRTGEPSRSRWDEVTVSADSCVSADVAAKAAFLLSDEGLDWLDERGLPGRFVADGFVHVNEAWSRALAASVVETAA